MAPIMALIPNIFKATSMSLLFVSTAAKLRSLDSKRSWASLPTKTPFRCGFYLNLHQMDKHMAVFNDLSPDPAAAPGGVELDRVGAVVSSGDGVGGSRKPSGVRADNWVFGRPGDRRLARLRGAERRRGELGGG